MHPLAQLDHAHVWHPFTQMRDWLKQEPILIVAGEGAVLRDVHGNEYLDGNSSIWTNLHGHNHPVINVALRRQLRKIAHSSALGLANEPATLLAAKLVEVANRNEFRGSGTQPVLSKVFFSDDGSTAMEVAIKLSYEYARRVQGLRKPRFLSMDNAYHGDTIGAVSVGQINLFHQDYAGLRFQADKVMAPYCYRCPFNRAKPARADAREYRECRWECVHEVEGQFARRKKRGSPYAAFIVEPLVQGAGGMIPQPAGWLSRVAEIARHYGALLVADEVLTGFGRTGTLSMTDRSVRNSPTSRRENRTPSIEVSNEAQFSPLFAAQHEGVTPDFLALAKGLTGGYLPMAATLTTQSVFDAFLGEYDQFRTFFHGHSYTGNQLGSSAALASLDILQSAKSARARESLQHSLRDELKSLWSLPTVGDIRQVGLIVGVELVKDWRTRAPFDLRERAGIRVCETMAKLGVLTRPIGNVVVLIPPYCTTADQVRRLVDALRQAIESTLKLKATP